MAITLPLHILGGARGVVSYAEGQRSRERASFVPLVNQS
jgi:hypothetical protein